MAQKCLKFGIKDGMGRHAATWKLWTETAGGKSDIYLACRSLGGHLKTSLHESGKWHHAFSQNTFNNNVEGALLQFEDRYIEKWARPSGLAPGITDAFRIVTPWSATTIEIEESNVKGIIWVPNAPEQKATEIIILITQSATPITGWPGKRAMGSSLIGSIPLENKETVWAVHTVIDMPDFKSLGNGACQFYKGRTKKDLEKESLRAMVFGEGPGGSKVIYDIPVKPRLSTS